MGKGSLVQCTGPSFSWLGRQIVNLEVAGSSPVGPAIHFSVVVVQIPSFKSFDAKEFPYLSTGGLNVL